LLAPLCASWVDATVTTPTKRITGGCLCGAFRFSLDGPIEVINYCHCSRCRRRTGSAFATVLHAKFSDFTIVAGEAQIMTFIPEGWGRRQFCRTCGSPLPRWSEADDEVGIPAGLLDQDPGARPSLHIMVGSSTLV